MYNVFTITNNVIQKDHRERVWSLHFHYSWNMENKRNINYGKWNVYHVVKILKPTKSRLEHCWTRYIFIIINKVVIQKYINYRRISILSGKSPSFSLWLNFRVFSDINTSWACRIISNRSYNSLESVMLGYILGII